MIINFYKLKSADTDSQKSHNKGFTLLETLVALSILLVAVVGPMSLLGNSLNKIYYARDEMIAVNLAQEAIETVRQIRDTNMLGGLTWDNNRDGIILSGDYTVDVGTLMACSSCGANGGPVLYDDVTGLYRQDSGSITPFSRKVNISGSGNERKVTATVSWNTGSTSGSVVVSDSLFKWVPY